MDSSSDNVTSISLLNAVPTTGVDHAPTAFATEACSPGTPVTVPVPKQLGSAIGRGLEIQPLHMSLTTHSPSSLSLSDAITQISESEQNIQDSGSALFANAPNTLMTDSTFTHISLPTQSPSFPDAIMQVSESEQNLSILDSSSGFFANAQNILITGGTFVNNNILPANTERKIPVLQKPNSSSLFVGRDSVLDQLRKIFIHSPDSKLMIRHSCLLWGTGGIGKTQICLKFYRGNVWQVVTCVLG